MCTVKRSTSCRVYLPPSPLSTRGEGSQLWLLQSERRVVALLTRSGSKRRASEEGCPEIAAMLGGLLDAQEDVCVLPESFEVEVAALIFGEDVQNHVAVVHQDPTAGRFAFDGVGELLRFFL